jgi:hypothetical protein
MSEPTPDLEAMDPAGFQKPQEIRMGSSNPNHDPRQRIINRLRPEDLFAKRLRDQMTGVSPGPISVPAPAALTAPPDPAPVVGSGVFDDPAAAKEVIQIDMENVRLRLAKSDTLRDVRYAVSMVPTLFPTVRWEPDFLRATLEATRAHLMDDAWVFEACTILTRMNPHWESGRAARAITYMALFQALSYPLAVENVNLRQADLVTAPALGFQAAANSVRGKKEFKYPCPVRGCYKKYNDLDFFKAHMVTKHPGFTIGTSGETAVAKEEVPSE